MDTIASFTIDHTKLKRGVYVSRQDRIGDGISTTFDIRMKEPNNEAALSSAAAHTIEHIGATFLRNHKEYRDKILYFGPMGCLTGFYLLLTEKIESVAIIPLIRELFNYIAQFSSEIPGASAIECGNHTLMDLPKAKAEAGTFFREILKDIRPENLVYPENSSLK
ncbi:S-ribosylhomocysteine lyase [Desulforhopalus sp. 52FAK]